MTVAAVSAVPAPQPLEAFRDDGPVAGAIGASLGRRLPLPPALLLLAAAVPLFAAIAASGDEGSDLLAASVVGWIVLLGGLASARPAAGRFAWAVPLLLRAVEYSAIVWLASLAAGDAGGAAFALLAAAAFRHYDTVYRLRHQGRVAPRWVALAGGGWDGRLVVVLALLLVGALPAGLYVVAAALAAAFVTESVRSWTRQGVIVRPPMDDQDEEEEAG